MPHCWKEILIIWHTLSVRRQFRNLIYPFCRKSGGSGGSPVRTAMVIQDDSLPAAPPPQIRILKRPSSNGSLGNASALARPAVQVKSLAQREAEYAEARRRILGSASSEESTSDKPSPERWELCPFLTTAEELCVWDEAIARWCTTSYHTQLGSPSQEFFTEAVPSVMCTICNWLCVYHFL